MHHAAQGYPGDRAALGRWQVELDEKLTLCTEQTGARAAVAPAGGAGLEDTLKREILPALKQRIEELQAA